MATTSTPTNTAPLLPDDDPRPTAATMLQEELEALDLRFIGHDSDDLMMALKQVVREHITRSRHGE